ncbi:MAG: uroporphyrinogen decarboxylase family protein [Eubacteriales bacterium]
MSYANGMAAINLEMPDMVPRTEYSVDRNWPLIKAVTGIDVSPTSSVEEQIKAGSAIRKAWDYGFRWNILTDRRALDKCRTSMGHADYEENGSDYDNEVYCPFEDPEDALDFQPEEVYGKLDHSKLVKDYNDNYQKMVDESPDCVNTTGIYISPVSGLVEIFGWDIMLMAMGIDAEGFGEVANRYAKWMQQYFNALADCDTKVVKIHDDIVWTAGPFAHPDWYRKYIFPNYKRLFAPLHEAGKKIIFTSDGTYDVFIDDIADCGIDGFVMEPTTNMAYIAEKYGKTHSFIGNADTRILLSGTKEDIYNEVKRCMDIGKKCPGFIMAVGNHIPANTPIENALYYNEVFEQMRKR